MANATTEKNVAPSNKEIVIDGEKVFEGSNEHTYLTMTFDPAKKYMFEATDRSIERELPIIDMREKRAIKHNPFRPYQNIVLTSQIVWKGQRRLLRYYAGCDTLFQDKQPKEKETLDSLIAGTNPVRLLEGKFGAYGDERMLLLYLFMCSWNAESPFKTNSSSTVFIASNADKIATEEGEKLDKIEEALKYAREASGEKMRMHCAYLGISDTDYDSGNKLSDRELRTKYRQAAADNPKTFIESYGNQTIEVKYYIDKALAAGTISNKFNPNKATWKQSNTVICDISGLKSHEAIAQRLFEFSQTEEGEEFTIQLKALFK